MSSLRRFYRHLLRDGERTDDPTALTASPRLPRSLPKSLSEAQVESLLAAPDTTIAEGFRDRVMLELLYASGLRVSELVGLPVAAVSLDMGVLRVMGKGSKERLVPIGEEALDWVVRYLRGARVELLDGQQSAALFVTRRCQAMSRQAFWLRLRQHAMRAGIGGTVSAARAAARLRHPPAQPRRRPARGAAPARPRRHLDHPDLHPRGTRTSATTAPSAPPAGLSGRALRAAAPRSARCAHRGARRRGSG
jgi:site-specific recombinase XerD